MKADHLIRDLNLSTPARPRSTPAPLWEAAIPQGFGARVRRPCRNVVHAGVPLKSAPNFCAPGLLNRPPPAHRRPPWVLSPAVLRRGPLSNGSYRSKRVLLPASACPALGDASGSLWLQISKAVCKTPEPPPIRPWTDGTRASALRPVSPSFFPAWLGSAPPPSPLAPRRHNFVGSPRRPRRGFRRGCLNGTPAESGLVDCRLGPGPHIPRH